MYLEIHDEGDEGVFVYLNKARNPILDSVLVGQGTDRHEALLDARDNFEDLIAEIDGEL